MKMAHGLNSVLLKRTPSTVATASQKVDGGKVGGIGSRRIFAPQFKLQVLDSYRNDADCKGNQRATARKYGIHRRQIQKWLQVEQNLRNSVLKLKSNRGEGITPQRPENKCEVALSDLRQQDDIKPGVYSHAHTEQRVPYIHVASPVVYTQTSPELHLVPTAAAAASPPTDSAIDFTAQPRAHHTPYIRERELAADFTCDESCIYESSHLPYPIDLSLKKPPCCCSTYCPPVLRPKTTYYYPPPSITLPTPIPYYIPTPPSDNEIWDLSLKKPLKRKHEVDWLPISPPLEPHQEEKKTTYHVLEVRNSSPEDVPVKKVKLFKPYLDDDDYCSSSSNSSQGFLNNNNVLQPLPYYPYTTGICATSPPETSDEYTDEVHKRQSYSLKFKLSAIECYYNDEACRGNQRAVANKYRVHRRQVQKWLKQENELRERSETGSCEIVVS